MILSTVLAPDNMKLMNSPLHDPMHEIDAQASHIWMVRAFLKHSDEATDDEELAEIHRDLYDFMLAIGPALEANDPEQYLRFASKKFSKLRKAAELFAEIQPEVSGHTNFRMAARSLTIAVQRIGEILSLTEKS
jgi:cob(I)alamin adenosyltransferase